MKVCSKDSEFSCDSDKLYEKLRRRLKPEMETGSRPEVRGKSKKVLFLKFSWSLNSYLVFSRCSWYRKCPNQTGSWFKIAYEDIWLVFFLPFMGFWLSLTSFYTFSRSIYNRKCPNQTGSRSKEAYIDMLLLSFGVFVVFDYSHYTFEVNW